MNAEIPLFSLKIKKMSLTKLIKTKEKIQIILIINQDQIVNLSI